jgi:large subunit ribosomal protein L30e
MREVESIVKRVLKTGNYYLGSKKTLKALKNGEAKAVIVASNCPEDVLEKIKSYGVTVYVYSGNNMDLGTLCGKPFSVAAMAVTEDLE